MRPPSAPLNAEFAALLLLADFICVGMFDWQVVDNMNLASRILRGTIERNRPWRALSA